nr:PP2C family serine/threonine-protein phosphatase [uncultured Tyzzerella sp.]
MRKQNSEFNTKFISEAGSELKNSDYFAFVELDKYACYVIADGINDVPDCEGAKLAIQSVILKFQENPSISRNAIRSYLKEANKRFLKADSKFKLKASITVVISNYEKIRYGHLGNTRFRLYRGGFLKEESTDMSLADDMIKQNNLSKDLISKHEERNNLYSYLGKEKNFKPFISKKIKLMDSDIIALYTRGIWENLDQVELNEVFEEATNDAEEVLNNIEDLILSKQPKQLENYTFVVIFVNKIFKDPERKRKIKKAIKIVITIIIIVLIISVIMYVLYSRRMKKIENLNLAYQNTIEYIEDNNYIRAKEECNKALQISEKLKDKEKTKYLNNYLKLIESTIIADEQLENGKYKDAQISYSNAKSRAKFADNINIEYIERKQEETKGYINVYDYINLGDTLKELEDYKNAEEKYLQAKNLASDLYFNEGKEKAIQALEKLYQDWDKEKQKDEKEQKDKADKQLTALDVIKKGDESFKNGDYEGAKLYYTDAIEKYTEMEDLAKIDFLQSKLKSINQKIIENEEKIQSAQNYERLAIDFQAENNLLEAKKQYLIAKKIYTELGKDDKIIELNSLIEMLDLEIEQQNEKLKEDLTNNQTTTEDQTETTIENNTENLTNNKAS